MLPFFDGCGPFKGWLPAGNKFTMEEMRSSRLSDEMSSEVEELVRSTVRKIRAEGGEVVGLIGFSQGTRVVAGLLKGSQIRRALGAQASADTDWLDFHFGVSICSSYPPPLIPQSIALQLASSSLSQEEQDRVLNTKIQVPSFIALGKQDVYMEIGKAMIEKHYEVGPSKCVVQNWNNGHHYPVEPEESQMIGDWMIDMLERTKNESTLSR